MTDAQTEARAIARYEFTCPDCDPYVVEVNHGQYVRYADHTTALAAKNAELAEVKENCETVCNSYENQRLYDRAERAEAQLAEANKALELALEYWADRQQRYKNRAPAWVVAARRAREQGGSDAE